MSLLSAAERFAAIDRSTVVFENKRCLHSRERFSECDACLRACPVGAINPGKPPGLVVEKCIHCLACLPTCPSGAFHASDFLPALMNCLTRIENRQVELVCRHNTRSDLAASPQVTGVFLPDCLAGMGTGGYAALAGLGLETVFIRLDGCSDCPWGELRSMIETQVELARSLLAPWQKEGMIHCVEETSEARQGTLLDIENPPLTRRDLFRLATRQGQVAFARAMELDAVPRANQPNHDRLRIVGALRHLPSPSTAADPQLVGGHFALVSISSACTACGACARACPTDALQFNLNETQQTFQLSFSPTLCIGCEVCNHVCEPGAVTLQHDPSFSAVFGSPEPTILQQAPFARCERCKAVYPAREGAHLCPICEYRSKNPFGSLMPSLPKKASQDRGKKVLQ